MPPPTLSALLALADDYGATLEAELAPGVPGAVVLNVSDAESGHAGLMLSRADARALARWLEAAASA